MVDPIMESGANPLKTPRPVTGRGTKDSPRETLSRMREKIFAEALGKPLPECLRVPEDSGDEADHAREECSRDLSLLLTSRSKRKIQALEEALAKVEEGTYGICEECDDPIGAGRLKAMPLAKLCVACQSTWEKEANSPRTQEGLLYPDEEGAVFP
jgi:RNA polymerase-binding protein DksA